MQSATEPELKVLRFIYASYERSLSSMQSITPYSRFFAQLGWIQDALKSMLKYWPDMSRREETYRLIDQLSMPQWHMRGDLAEIVHILMRVPLTPANERFNAHMQEFGSILRDSTVRARSAAARLKILRRDAKIATKEFRYVATF